MLADVASFARDRIWRREPEALPADPPIQLDQPVPPFDLFAFYVSTTPEVLWLITDAAGDLERSHAVDLHTGERLGPGHVLDFGPLGNIDVTLGHALEGATPLRAVGGDDRALVLARFDIESFVYPEHPRERLLYRGPDVEGWAAVPMCLPGDPDWDMFTAEGEVWYAEADGQREGQQVWWSSVRAAR